MVALTATATAEVQRDIVTQLRLRDPLVVAASFNRPNIKYVSGRMLLPIIIVHA
jgi:ATP-dependent DNA helicase RecQ